MTATPPLAMDLLLVDIGNTRLRAALVQGGQCLEEWSWVYSDADSLAAANPAALDSVGQDFYWSWQWRSLLGRLHSRRSELPIYIASVAPRQCKVALEEIKDVGFRTVHVAVCWDPWPFKIDIESLETIGIDRLANIAGLVGLGMQSAIAVDLGTAVTIDVLEQGCFRGGMILPGLVLQAQALHDHTATLPLVDMTQSVAFVGRSTPEAMVSGITNVTLEGVAAVAQRLASKVGQEVPIVCTGGWGERLMAHVHRARYEADLTFLGLRALAARRS